MGDLLSGKRRVRPGEGFLMAAVYGAASMTIFLLLGIIGYVFFRGFRMVSLRFLVSVTDSLKGTVGIGGNLVNTLYILGLTLGSAVPAGVGAAIYLNEYAKPGALVKLIDFTTETLAGIPSVIFGLFGMVFFGGVLGMGFSLISGSLTLTLMVLPLIVRNTQEALRAVPEGYRSAALGMGAGRWYMIRTVLLPDALPGILTGVLLAAGRIVGESAALLFTAGSAGLLPRQGETIRENIGNLIGKALEPGGTLSVELYLQMQEGSFEAAFGTGCVLILITFAVNLLFRLAAGQMKKGGGRGAVYGK
ncbi:MAG: phosphate ABC transporter permease PstA [Acetatifactor sp.]|nr:phosphate ABC transporter permease PstA [Acetatifactor sp.]